MCFSHEDRANLARLRWGALVATIGEIFRILRSSHIRYHSVGVRSVLGSLPVCIEPFLQVGAYRRIVPHFGTGSRRVGGLALIWMLFLKGGLEKLGRL